VTLSPRVGYVRDRRKRSLAEVDSSQRVAGACARTYLRGMEAAPDSSALGSAGVHKPTPVRSTPSSAMFWLVGFGAWTALALLATMQTAMAFSMRGQPIEWPRLLAWRAIDWYSCALFVPPFLWLVRRAPLERSTWARRLPMYIGVTLVATIAKYALLVSVQSRFLGPARSQSFFVVLAGNAISELMIFWAVIGVLHAVEFYRRYREREALTLELRAQLSQSQLDVLRAQLHPHFLFNVLNAATVLVHRDPEAADAMLTRLGELLRHALRSDPRHETSLREELELLDRYLDIMRTRFGDRLTIERSVPPALESALVPTFVLQPLVENALEHGVDRVEGSARVEIDAARDGDRLTLAVRDNGAGDQSHTHAGLGIGLTNTRARLTALYGDAAELALRPRPGGGTEVVLRLPLRTPPAV
jgi:two-component system, LytTR family, sensor kinase